MVCTEAVFGCAETLTPEIAAELAQAVEHFDARLYMECAGKRVRLDSLIGILALDCQQGTRLTIVAEGREAERAAEAVVALLQG